MLVGSASLVGKGEDRHCLLEASINGERIVMMLLADGHGGPEAADAAVLSAAETAAAAGGETAVATEVARVVVVAVADDDTKFVVDRAAVALAGELGYATQSLLPHWISIWYMQGQGSVDTDQTMFGILRQPCTQDQHGRREVGRGGRSTPCPASIQFSFGIQMGFPGRPYAARIFSRSRNFSRRHGLTSLHDASAP